MQDMRVSELRQHPQNQFFFDDMEGQKWKEFVESVRTSGVIEPLVVTQDKIIVSGHQRVRACAELGIDFVPCEVRIFDSDDEVLKQLIETNIRQRGNINSSDLKMGRIIKEMERIYGTKQGRGGDTTSNPHCADCKTQSDIAGELNLSVDKAARLKKLADLPPEYQELLLSGQINTKTAWNIIAKLTEEEQTQLLSQLPIAQKLTQSQVQAEVDKIKAEHDVKEKAWRKANDEKDQMISEERAKSEKLASVEIPQDQIDEYYVQKVGEAETAAEAERRVSVENNLLEKRIKEMEKKHKEELADYERRNAALNKELESASVAVPDDYESTKQELDRLTSELEAIKNAKSVNDKVIRTIGRDISRKDLVTEQANRLHSLISSTQCDLGYFVREESIVREMPTLVLRSIVEQSDQLVEKVTTIINYIEEVISCQSAAQ